MERCILTHNSAQPTGGAIYAEFWDVSLKRCDFVLNTAQGNLGDFGYQAARGGAIYTHICRLRAERTSFTSNSIVAAHSGSGSIGGAIAGERLDFLEMVSCTFTGNSCAAGLGGKGGAIYTVTGGIPNPSSKEEPEEVPSTFANCLFNGNTAGHSGGAIYCQSGIRTDCCTFANNTASIGEGGALCTESVSTGGMALTNVILWDNVAGGSGHNLEKQFGPLDSSGESDVYDVSYSCVKDLVGYYSDNNTNADPDFVNPAGGNFRLRWCSPALDQGDADQRPPDDFDLDNDDGTVLLPLDRDDLPRVRGGGLDMGAFEQSCTADLNGDGTVNGADLGILLSEWGCSTGCPSDLDCDGNVNGADLGTLLAAWNSECPVGGTEEFSMMMSSGGSELDALLAYLGATSIEEASAALAQMEFEDMATVLGSFLNP